MLVFKVLNIQRFQEENPLCRAYFPLTCSHVYQVQVTMVTVLCIVSRELNCFGLLCAQCYSTCVQLGCGLCSSIRSCSKMCSVRRTVTTSGVLPTWHTMAILSGELLNMLPSHL